MSDTLQKFIVDRLPHAPHELFATLQSGSRLYALPDGTRIDELIVTLYQKLEVEAYPLLPSPPEEVRPLLPYLFQVSGADSPEAQWLYELPHSAFPLLIESKAPLLQVTEQLGRLTQAKLPEKSSTWFRFYDPFIFYSFYPTMTEEQAALFWGTKEENLSFFVPEPEPFLDKEAGPQIYKVSPKQRVPATAKQLELKIGQIDAMEKVRFVKLCSTMEDYLKENFAEESAGYLRLTEHVKDSVEQAMFHGFSTEQEIVHYVLYDMHMDWNLENKDWAKEIFTSDQSPWLRIGALHTEVTKLMEAGNV